MITIDFKEGCHFTIHNIPFGVFSLSSGGDGRVRLMIFYNPSLLLLCLEVNWYCIGRLRCTFGWIGGIAGKGRIVVEFCFNELA